MQKEAIKKSNADWVRTEGWAVGRVCEGLYMDENFSEMGTRERQIIDLLLQGCDNSEIARDLNIAERTVKAYFNRLFVRFGIKGGIKRVKLATMLYRRQLWQERRVPSGGQAHANTSSSST